jgi:hypothetical protein
MQSLDRAVHYQNAAPPTEIRSAEQKCPEKQVTKRQRLFVEECLGSTEKTFDEVMKHHFVTTDRFAGWMMEPAFRCYLKRIAKSLHAQTRLILSIGQKRSAMFLLRAASTTAESAAHDKKRTSRVKAAEVLLRFLTTMERNEQLNSPRRDRPHAPQLVPPGRSEQEVLRLMDIIEGRSPAD